MIIGAVRRFEDLQPGAWFYFNRLGEAGVALKVIDKMPPRGNLWVVPGGCERCDVLK